MKKHLFFIDAETDGLYGPVLSVAVIVTDLNLLSIEERYIGIRKDKLEVKDSWVKENVVPILGDYEEYDSEADVLEAVWQLWMRYQEDSYAIADVAYPVEMRIFERCVMKDQDARRFMAPYPLIDLSSLLFAKGYDPLVERVGLIDTKENIRHNALDDVRISIEILKMLGIEGIL